MLRKILFVIIAAVFFGMNVQAQGCAEPTSEEGVNVFGFLQAQYDYGFTDGDNTSTFGFNRSRIGVMGNIPYDFSYYVLLETSPFKKEGPKAYLLDAFITYSRFDFAKVSLGSFKSPFGQELSTACHALHTINRSKFVNELTAPDRDMGIMLLGGSDSTLFRYALAYMNGSGLLVQDQDKYKDLIGRLMIQPTDWMHVGGSFRTGKSVNEDPTVDADERTRFGAEFEIEKFGFLVQGEYIWAEDKGSYLVGGGCGGDPEVVQGSVEREGLSIMALYNTPWNLQPVIKYENYNSDLSLDGNNNMEHITTVGVNYFFNEWTRLQVNYEYKAEWAGEIDNDMLMVQLQVRF